MRSLRWTLALGTSLGIAGVLGAAGFLLYGGVRTNVHHQMDEALLKEARQLSSAVETMARGVKIEFDQRDMSDFEGDEPAACLELFLPDGTSIYRSPGLGDAGLPRDRPEVVIPHGGRARAVRFDFTPAFDDEDDDEPAWPVTPPPERLTLVLARSAAGIDSFLAGLRFLLLAGGLVTVLAAAGVLWIIIRRSLVPVERLAARLSDLDAGDLTRRFEAGGVPAEITPVVDRLNEMLARLETSFDRERAFSADVAHELRTPLAGLRSTLEVALSRSREPAVYREAITDALKIAGDMQGMVEKLLCLARLESGSRTAETELVDLVTLVRETWKTLETPARERRLRVEQRLPADAWLRTDPVLVELAIRNLLENAVLHADAGGSVSLAVTRDDGKAEVTIRNSGSRIARESVARITERFVRGSAARTEANAHAGLGLALARRAILDLGGALTIDSRDGGDFVVVMRVPAIED